MEKLLPPIPAKRYFTIGEVSELCGVKPYVLRYWEQEFAQLKPMKRRGNRRYYQHHEVLLIRRIRDLLYEQGFTISGARNRLTESASAPVTTEQVSKGSDERSASVAESGNSSPIADGSNDTSDAGESIPQPEAISIALSAAQMREELIAIRELLAV